MGGCNHKTMKSWGLLGLRLCLAFILISLGYSKLGPMHAGTAAMMSSKVGLGSLGNTAAYLVGFLEFVGGLMILLGVYAPIAAAWVSFIVLVAIFTVHAGGPANGYFLALAVLGMCLALMGTGAGKFRLLKCQCCCKECKAGGGLNGCCGKGGNCGTGGGCGCGNK